MVTVCGYEVMVGLDLVLQRQLESRIEIFFKTVIGALQTPSRYNSPYLSKQVCDDCLWDSVRPLGEL